MGAGLDDLLCLVCRVFVEAEVSIKTVTFQLGMAHGFFLQAAKCLLPIVER